MTLDRTKGMWERILEALEAKNAPEVARKLQKTKQAAYEWRDGKPPALETLIDIAETSNVSLSWLILNKGPKKLTDVRGPHQAPENQPKKTEVVDSAISPEVRTAIRGEVFQALATLGLILSAQDREMADSLVKTLALQIEKAAKK